MSLESTMDSNFDPPRNTLAHPYYSYNEHAIHYSASNPYRADGIDSGGVIAGPSTGAAFIPSPLQRNTPPAPQDISPVQPSFPYTRQDIQYPIVSIDIYPEQNTVGDWDSRSPSTRTPLTPRSPRPGSLDPASAESASLSSHSNAVDRG
jgi:hypothetical protein